MGFLVAIMFIGNLGWTEWVLILFVVLILFGGRKIPQLAKDLGTGIREFRKSLSGTMDQITDETKPEEPGAEVKPAKKAARKKA